MKISKKGFLKDNFSFQHVSDDNILKVIDSIDSSKAYQKDNIPPKLLKQNKDISALVLANETDRCIDEGTFPSNLKKC